MPNATTFSELFSATRDELAQNSKLVLVYVLVVAPFTGLSNWFQGETGRGNLFNFNIGFNITEQLIAQGLFSVAVVIVSFIVGVVMYYWLYAGMMQRTLSPTRDRFWPFVGIYFLSVLGMAFGFMLLVIPGIILAVRWIFVLCLVIQNEEPAMDSFGKSWQMTSGSFWVIFFVGLVLIVILAAVNTVVGIPTSFAGGVIAHGAATIVQTITGAVMVAFAVGAYRKLGNPVDEIEDIFG